MPGGSVGDLIIQAVLPPGYQCEERREVPPRVLNPDHLQKIQVRGSRYVRDTIALVTGEGGISPDPVVGGDDDLKGLDAFYCLAQENKTILIESGLTAPDAVDDPQYAAAMGRYKEEVLTQFERTLREVDQGDAPCSLQEQALAHFVRADLEGSTLPESMVIERVDETLSPEANYMAGWFREIEGAGLSKFHSLFVLCFLACHNAFRVAGSGLVFAILLTSGAGLGKSFLFKLLCAACVPGTAEFIQHETPSARQTPGNRTGARSIYDELPKYVAARGEDGTGDGKTRSSFTSTKAEISYFGYDEETGERQQMSAVRAENRTVIAGNNSGRIPDEMASRFFIIPVTGFDRPGGNPMDKAEDGMSVQGGSGLGRKAMVARLQVMDALVAMVSLAVDTRTIAVPGVFLNNATYLRRLWQGALGEDGLVSGGGTRDFERFNLLVRALTIHLAVARLCFVPGAYFTTHPFSVSEFLWMIEPQLVATDEILYWALQLVAPIISSPLTYSVVRGLGLLTSFKTPGVEKVIKDGAWYVRIDGVPGGHLARQLANAIVAGEGVTSSWNNILSVLFHLMSTRIAAVMPEDPGEEVLEPGPSTPQRHPVLLREDNGRLWVLERALVLAEEAVGREPGNLGPFMESVQHEFSPPLHTVSLTPGNLAPHVLPRVSLGPEPDVFPTPHLNPEQGAYHSDSSLITQRDRCVIFDCHPEEAFRHDYLLRCGLDPEDFGVRAGPSTSGEIVTMDSYPGPQLWDAAVAQARVLAIKPGAIQARRNRVAVLVIKFHQALDNSGLPPAVVAQYKARDLWALVSPLLPRSLSSIRARQRDEDGGGGRPSKRHHVLPTE